MSECFGLEPIGKHANCHKTKNRQGNKAFNKSLTSSAMSKSMSASSRWYQDIPPVAERGNFWWTSQVLAFMLRPDAALRAEVRDMKARAAPRVRCDCPWSTLPTGACVPCRSASAGNPGLLLGCTSDVAIRAFGRANQMRAWRRARVARCQPLCRAAAPPRPV